MTDYGTYLSYHLHYSGDRTDRTHLYKDQNEILPQKIQNDFQRSRSCSEVTEFAVCMFDCDDLKYINDKYGHEKGDEYLKTATRLICKIFKHSPVFRIGGDEFISFLKDEDFDIYEELIAKFEAETEAVNKAALHEWECINLSFGLAEYNPHTDKSVEDTASRADKLMYENKRERKSGRKVR